MCWQSATVCLKKLFMFIDFVLLRIKFYTEWVDGGEYFEQTFSVEPYYIYNVGYFYIGGFIENKNAEELSRINKLFQDYNNNYDKMSFPFSDSDYLNLNK